MLPFITLARLAAFFPACILFTWYILSLHRTWCQKRLARAKQCRPPPRLPSRDPVLALDILYANLDAGREHRALALNLERFLTYGNTFVTKRLATPFFHTREPENVKTVLSLNFKDYGMGERVHTFGPLLGHGIFTSDGEDWAQSRRMIRPNFIKEQVAHLDIFETLLGDLFALIPGDESAVDLQELFFEFSIDSATEFLFGHSTHTLKKHRLGDVTPTALDFASAFNYAQGDIVVNTRLGQLRALNFDRKAAQCNQLCRAVVDEYVNKALQTRGDDGEDTAKSKRYTFLNGLAQQTGDRDRIRNELMNVLLAGRDTTASLMSNMFFMMAKNPRIWAKLRQELAYLEGRPPTYEQLRDMKYLKYCINESLRLHPVVPINTRTATSDTVLPVGGGPDGRSPVLVPKGSLVSYSVWSMHRREDFFGPDADQYRPERWETLRTGWEYLPFNGGPRICIGQQYAITEAAYVTTRIAQRFSVLESRDPGAWEENLTLTLCSRNGTRVSLRK